MKKTLILIVGILILSTTVFSQVRITGNTVISGAGSSGTTVDGGGLLAGANVVITGDSFLVDDSGNTLGATVTVTGGSCVSSGICTIIATNTYQANQWVSLQGLAGSPCTFVYGTNYYGTGTLLYPVLSAGLSSSQFEVQTSCTSAASLSGIVEDASYYLPIQTISQPGFKGINAWYLRNDVIGGMTGLVCGQAMNFDAMFGDLFPNNYLPNLIPPMTSTTLPSGVVSSSSDWNSSNVSWMAMNASQGGWMSGGSPGWIEYQFPIATTVTSYSIMPLDYTAYPDPGLTVWTLQGSNDGSSWTILDSESVSLSFWIVSKYSTWSILTPGSYLYYKLNITGDAGHNVVGLKQWKLNGPVVAGTGKPLYILEESGNNDISNGENLATIQACYQSVWAQAHAAGAYIVQNTDIHYRNNQPNFNTPAVGMSNPGIAINPWLIAQGKSIANASSGQFWDYPGVDMRVFGPLANNPLPFATIAQIAQAWNAAVSSTGTSGFVLSNCNLDTDCPQLDQKNFFTYGQGQYAPAWNASSDGGTDSVSIGSSFWNSSVGYLYYLDFQSFYTNHHAFLFNLIPSGTAVTLQPTESIGWYSIGGNWYDPPVIQFSLDPSGNYINVGNGTIGDYSKSLKLTGIMGQVTAPSGSCTANGLWELTQDGALTRCLSSVWTPFGIGGSGSYQPLTLVSTTDPPIATCDSTHNVGTLATSTTLSLYQCSNNNSSATYVWNVLASSTVAFTLTTSGSGAATYSGGVLNIPISSSGGGGLSSGQPLVLSNLSYATINGFDGYTVATQIPSALVLQSNGSFKIQIQAVGGTGISINSAWIFATNPFSLTTLTTPAPVQITWNGGSAAYATAYSGVTTTSPFILNSDSVTFPIDYTHDYYVFIYLDSDSTKYNSNLVIWDNEVSGIHGGFQRGNTIPSTSGGTVITPWPYSGNTGLVTKIIAP